MAHIHNHDGGYDGSGINWQLGLHDKVGYDSLVNYLQQHGNPDTLSIFDHPNADHHMTPTHHLADTMNAHLSFSQHEVSSFDGPSGLNTIGPN